MNEYELSICIPSKRDFQNSKDSISAAIGFCESSNSDLYISDSSQDNNKKVFWQNLKLKNFYYSSSNHRKPADNWHNAAKKASGMFIGMCSDDDLLLNITKPAIEYSMLPSDIIGIKPTIQLWSETHGIYNTNRFSLEQDTALERVKNYLSNCKGNNTTLYSFFRSHILQDLQEASLFHPIKAGCADWTLVLALVSSGKVVIDPSKLYIYKNYNWIGTKVDIDNEQKSLYRKVSVSERALYFSLLFRALEGLIYIIRKNSPLKRKEAIEAGEFVFQIYLELFQKEYFKNKDLYFPDEKKKIEDIKLNLNIKEKLDLVLTVIDTFDKEIARKFVTFFEKVTGNIWGNIK